MNELPDILRQALDFLLGLLTPLLDLIPGVRDYLLEQFGPAGLLAAFVAAAAIVCLTLWQIIKIGFATVKYLVIPSLALAFVGSLVLPVSFATLLPVTVALCSVLLLFKA